MYGRNEGPCIDFVNEWNAAKPESVEIVEIQI